MTRTVSQKMGIKENSRAFLVQTDNEVLDNINLPTLNIPANISWQLTKEHAFYIAANRLYLALANKV